MRLCVLTFSSAKFLSFRVWCCIFFQIKTRCGGKQRPLLQGWPSVWMQSVPSKLFCSPPKLYRITSNENAKQKTRCQGNSLFSSEFQRLAAQDEARSVPTNCHVGEVLMETARDFKRGWRFRPRSESEITDCHALLLINSLLNYVQNTIRLRRRNLAPYLYNSSRCGTKTNVYREPQHVACVSSTHATCWGQHWSSSGMKYVIFKSQNKMHV